MSRGLSQQDMARFVLILFLIVLGWTTLARASRVADDGGMIGDAAHLPNKADMDVDNDVENDVDDELPVSADAIYAVLKLAREAEERVIAPKSGWFRFWTFFFAPVSLFYISLINR